MYSFFLIVGVCDSEEQLIRYSCILSTLLDSVIDTYLRYLKMLQYVSP